MKSDNTYRVTRVLDGGKRQVSMMDDTELKSFRARRMRVIRKDELRLTQKTLAMAIGANLRTVQDWESGRSPMPKPVEKLLDLMRDIPAVRKRLLAAC